MYKTTFRVKYVNAYFCQDRINLHSTPIIENNLELIVTIM